MGDNKETYDGFKVSDSYVSLSPSGAMSDHVDVAVAKYAPAAVDSMVNVAVAKYAPATVDSMVNVAVAKYAPATVDSMVNVAVAKYAPATVDSMVNVAVAKYAPVAVNSNVVMSGVVPATASGLALTILGTINVQDLRCDSRGDQYAQAIFNNGSGYYDKLKKSFVNIATLCNKTLKNKKIDVASIKSNLKNAKKKAMSQSQSCEQRKLDMQKIYSQTKDIFTILK